jgi:hypothetical protein
MKRMHVLGLVTVLSAFAATATAEPDKKAPEKKEAAAENTVSDADAKQWLTFFDKLVDTVVAAHGDCDKMAKDLEALDDANKEVLAKAQKASAESKQLPKSAEEHMGKSVEKMLPALGKCGQNPKVQAAMRRTGGRPPR